MLFKNIKNTFFYSKHKIFYIKKMSKIIIPTPLRKFTDNNAQFETQASTVKQAIEKLTQQYPTLQHNILDENGKLRTFIKLYVGEDDMHDLQGENTPLDANSVISIVPAIAGGVQ